MYKYKNISDFRQSLVIKGKRVLLKPDDVVESDAELRFAFLEPVDLSTPTSNVSSSSSTKVDELQQRITGLEKEKDELSKNKEVYDTIDELDKAIKDLQNKFSDMAAIIGLIKTSQDDSKNKLEKLLSDSNEDKKIIIRRLEMLKSAVMTIEGEVFGANGENTQGK